MRGQKVFKEIIKDKGLGAPMQKGRNNNLIYKRNECLLARYYYYGYFKNMLYEETIRQLVGEFFLAPNTIAHIIVENTEHLVSLRKRVHVIYYFQSHWPHLKW